MTETLEGAGRTRTTELRVVVVDSSGAREQPVAVTMSETTTCGELAEAIEGQLDGPRVPGPALYSVRQSRAFPGDARALESDLRHGDLLQLVGAAETPKPIEATSPPTVIPGGVELVVTGGPCAGIRRRLGEGEFVIGRDGRCDVTIEDQSLSRQHARLRVINGEVAVRDEGSTNGTSVRAESLEPRQWEPVESDATVELGRSVISFQPLTDTGLDDQPRAESGVVPLNRPPRVAHPYQPPELELQAPPRQAQGLHIPIGASFVPLIMGVALWLVTDQVIMLMFAALSPMMAVWTYVEDRRGGRRRFLRETAKYRQAVVQVEDELAAAQATEVSSRRRAAPDPGEVARRAAAHDRTLWERRPADPDFLTLRIGLADQPTEVGVRFREGGDDELRQEGADAIRRHQIVPSVPVLSNMEEIGALGIAGPEGSVDSLGRWTVIQAAALHSPRDLLVVAALSPESAAQWEWLKWLPHVHTSTGVLDGPAVGVGRVAAAELLSGLADLIRARRAAQAERYGASASALLPRVLAVLDERVRLDRASVTSVLGDGPDFGVSAVWLGGDPRDLPGECGLIAQFDPVRSKMTVTEPGSGRVLENVTADGLTVELADECGRALSSLRDVGARSGSADVPSHVDLLDLMEPNALEPDAIAAAWAAPDNDLHGMLGSQGGEPLSVSLRGDGPHALVAGTTGSGKSELLQTFVASLALRHSPQRLSFLLIDYKGGAAFKDCRHLPHVVGMITDLDEALSQRALISLNAELRHRERLLGEAGLPDLVRMEQLAAEGAPASLVIVIDEFATLVQEIPDFMDGIIDIARRGRSLGVHVVLATQSPHGVVSDKILSNTNLRIALRLTAQDAKDVIGATDPAGIPHTAKGRAFVRSGSGDIVEFQAAYVGGATVEDTSRPAKLTVRPFQLSSPRAQLGPGGGTFDGPTDLARIVTAVREAAEAAEVDPPRPPWLPELPEAVPASTLVSDGTDRIAAVGLIDDPARQAQWPFHVDLESGSGLLIYGAGGSGKTTLLRTLAATLAASASPNEIHIYGLDYGGRGLASLEALPHCGSVITSSEQERTARLFAYLRTTTVGRRDAFAQAGVTTVDEYRRAKPDSPLARILVLLDGYATFQSTFERVNLGELIDQLPLVIAEGRAVGIHFAISAERRGAVPGALAGAISRTVILRLANEDDYAALGLSLKQIKGRTLSPGRGFDSSGLEVQIAVPGEEASGEGQATFLRALGSELAARHPHGGAPEIRVLPPRVTASELPSAPGPLQATLGVTEELTPAVVDIRSSHFLVAGPYRSGRSTAIATLASSLASDTPGARLHLLAPRPSPLTRMSIWASIATGADCGPRAQAFADASAFGIDDILVIDDGGEIAEGLGAPELDRAVRLGRDSGLRVIASAETQTALRQYSGWLREIRKDANGLIIDADPDIEGDLFQIRLPRNPIARGTPGRGYLVRGPVAQLIQVAAPAL